MSTFAHPITQWGSQFVIDSGWLASKITTVGNTTYVAMAKPGAAQASASWQCKKVYDDGAGTVTVTWADGDAEFDNVATDLSALTYK